ncbi:hypothetical protein D6D19_08920 [Aureobasidium pullulans]|uniref:Secreted protein n=1 Tax=Aureobasidium pullulans TaxID=5580 RepID=A0A4S8ZQE9_AURPU|nr:hypothetical protein D6D19_08920 [Aureobasidium pullulans]
MTCFLVLTLFAALAATSSPFSDRVSLANRTRRPYGPGSKKRCRACDLDRRTRERRPADAAQRAAEEAEEEANRGRRREEEKLAAPRSDPSVFNRRSLSPSPPHLPAPNYPGGHVVSVVEVMLVFMCFHCPYHISDPVIVR